MKITDAASFGKALRARRKALGYTQGQISEISGLSVSFLSDLENGKRGCELEKALQVMNLLGLDCHFSARGEAQ